MNNITTRIVHDTPVKQESTAPQAEGTNSVRESEPKWHKSHPSLKIHSSKH